jgi:hypothetical protein
MKKNKRVADMAEEVLEQQAKNRAERTGEPFEDAFETVAQTEAGQQLEELRDGSNGDERAREWQENVRRERSGERRTEGPDRSR